VRFLLLLALVAPVRAAASNVAIHRYGTMPDGRAVDQAVLVNDRGMIVKVIGYGATITEIRVPDRRGRKANVVLGYGSLADYAAKNGKNRFGAVVGRYAGRIAGARFTLDGREYRLKPNDGPNALHGGAEPGLDFKLWRVRPIREGRTVGAALTYTSHDGGQGFPGALTVTVGYRLQPDNVLRVDYEARTTKATILNLTNHSYFNLAGAASGSVAAQRLAILGARFSETDAHGIPTGRFPPVAGTPLDFRAPAPIGARWDTKGPPMSAKGGYNHSWIVDKPAGALAPAATLEDPGSGRRLELWTTEPVLTAYTGDYIDGQDVGGEGAAIHPRDGIALEPMHLSDSPNRPDFPTTVLRPGETFRATTLYRFTTAGTR
jgi:aldose 1-epimerase